MYNYVMAHLIAWIIIPHQLLCEPGKQSLSAMNLRAYIVQAEC